MKSDEVAFLPVGLVSVAARTNLRTVVCNTGGKKKPRAKSGDASARKGDSTDSRRPVLRSLQGWFLPADSSFSEEPDEDSDAENYDSFGDVREGLPRSGLELPAEEKKWNKRAEAAKKRWANPEYRKKMMEKRKEKKEGKERTEPERKHRVEIGSMDSVTLSSDEKAKQINAYALANKLRSEKLEKHHRNKEQWMQERLDSGAEVRERYNNEEYKKQRQIRRSEIAAERMRQRKMEETGQEDPETPLEEE